MSGEDGQRHDDVTPASRARAQAADILEGLEDRLAAELEALAADDLERAAVVRDLLDLGGVWENVRAEDPSGTIRRIGPFAVLRELGRGGQGAVYLAVDTRVDRKVALKVLHGMALASPVQLERFRREALVTARLDTPGVCTVYETGLDELTPYIAMRYVQGRSLAEVLHAAHESRERGAPSPRSDEAASSASLPCGPGTAAEVADVVAFLERAARNLHELHEAGVVHRDIKPGNIMVAEDGQPVVLDFGLARAFEDEELVSLTGSGDLFGTPVYMAPEQVAAARTLVDRRADVYALGVTLYECLTLELPFEGHTREALYRAILAHEPVDPRRLNARVGDDLAVVVATALDKDRERRYQTALALAEDLRRVREGRPIRARRAGLLRRVGQWCRLNPARATAAACALVVALGLAAWAGFQAADRDARGLQLENALLRLEQALGAEDPGAARAALDDAIVLGLEPSRRAAVRARIADVQLRVDAQRDQDEQDRWLREQERRRLGWNALKADPSWPVPAWHVHGAASVALSGDRSVVAVGDAGGAVYLWDAESVTSDRRLFPSPGARPVALQLDAQGRRVYAATSDARLVAFDVERPSEPVWNERLDTSAAWLRLSADGGGLVVLGADGVLGRRLAATGQLVHEHALWDDYEVGDATLVHQAEARDVLLVSDGDRFSLWDAQRGELVVGADRAARVVGQALSTGGEMAALLAATGEVTVIDARTGDERARFESPRGDALQRYGLDEAPSETQVGDQFEEWLAGTYVPRAGRDCLALSPDGEVVLVIGVDGVARLHASADGELLDEISPARILQAVEGSAEGVESADHDAPRVHGGAFLGDGLLALDTTFDPAGGVALLRWSAAGDLDGEWIGRTGLRRVLRGGVALTSGFRLDPMGLDLGKLSLGLAWGDRQGRWEQTTISTWAQNRRRVSVPSADGRWLASQRADGRLLVTETLTGRSRLAAPTGEVVAISDDGRHVRLAGPDEVERVHDVASGEVVDVPAGTFGLRLVREGRAFGVARREVRAWHDGVNLTLGTAGQPPVSQRMPYVRDIDIVGDRDVVIATVSGEVRLFAPDTATSLGLLEAAGDFSSTVVARDGSWAASLDQDSWQIVVWLLPGGMSVVDRVPLDVRVAGQAGRVELVGVVPDTRLVWLRQQHLLQLVDLDRRRTVLLVDAETGVRLAPSMAFAGDATGSPVRLDFGGFLLPLTALPPGARQDAAVDGWLRDYVSTDAGAVPPLPPSLARVGELPPRLTVEGRVVEARSRDGRALHEELELREASGAALPEGLVVDALGQAEDESTRSWTLRLDALDDELAWPTPTLPLQVMARGRDEHGGPGLGSGWASVAVPVPDVAVERWWEQHPDDAAPPEAGAEHAPSR